MITLVDVFEDQSGIYLICRYSEHGTLKEFLDRGAQLDLSDVRNFLFEILQGIKSLHKIDIVHRSLTLNSIKLKWKKGNILLQVGSLDFARSIKPGFKETQTFDFNGVLAPEIEAGEPYD